MSVENLRATTVEVADASGYRREPLLDFFMTRYKQAYANEIAAFVHAVESGSADEAVWRGRAQGPPDGGCGGCVA